MGFTTGDFPPVDPATFMQVPYRERTKTMSRFWVEYGFGAPKVVTVIYLMKLLVLSIIGGVVIATTTTGLSPFDFQQWWDEPIIYQKLVLWTVLLEAVGIAGSWGPLAGHFKPMTGGILYWARPGTIRLPPWPDKVPGTKGDERTVADAALYVAFLLALLAAIVLPGTGDTSLTEVLPGNEGLIAPGVLVVLLVLWVVLGLRDKIAFIAARSEQYLPAAVFFAFFPFVDMIVAAKILIVSVWGGASISKIGRHFHNVIPPMVSNTPWLSSKAVKRSVYENFPDDLRPSKRGVRLAHVGGTMVEMLTPLVLLFTGNPTAAAIAVIVMGAFHLFIISTFPLAVPLEWNALFIYITAFLFLGFPNQDGFGLGDMEPALMALTVAGCVFFPILGNLRPDLVSFLPSMRQYAGNWASAMWAFAPGCEKKLDEGLVKPALMQRQQLIKDYGDNEAEVILQQLLGWRSLHSQARGLNSVMMNHLGEDIDTYTLREAEFSCNAIIGFNFGDGHLHDERMLQAIQKRCNFAPGEFMVVWVESEPIANGRQQYWVMDVAVGIVERGSWSVLDCVKEQPWLPDGPVKTQVDWTMDGYERVRHAPAVTSRDRGSAVTV